MKLSYFFTLTGYRWHDTGLRKPMRPSRQAFSMAHRHEPSGAALDESRHFVALAVDVAHAVGLDFALCRRQEVVPYFGEYLADGVGFARFERRAGIAVEAALAVAGVEVAAKEALGKVEAYEGVLYLEHKLLVKYLLHRWPRQ